MPSRGIDAVRGVKADEAHGAIHILEDFGNGELRIAAMHHGKDGVSAVEQVGETPDRTGRPHVPKNQPPLTTKMMRSR